MEHIEHGPEGSKAHEPRTDNGSERREPRSRIGSNIVLIGGMGAGKTTVGWYLSRFLGHGHLDLDALIAARAKKSIAEIFADSGEEHFRQLEIEAIQRLQGISSHVLSVGGGAVMDDNSWELLSQLGVTVWLNTPPSEIARRFASNVEALRQRPLLAELATQPASEQRHKLLTERLAALIGNRVERYRQANVTVSDAFSTPESTAHLIKDVLMREGYLNLSAEHRPFDRWGIL